MHPPDTALSRRERERLARRKDMLASARAVFAEKGFAGATLEEIASRAEFGKGTLYNYFPDGKEEILFAVFDELYDDLVRIAHDALGVSGDGAAARSAASTRGAFEGFFSRCFAYYEEREELFMILTKEAYRMSFSEDRGRFEYFLRQRSRLVGALTKPIERAIHDGVMRPWNAEAIAQMLLGNIHGLQMHRCLGHKVAPKEADCLPSGEAAAFLTGLLFDGLLTGSPSPTEPDPS